MTAEQKHAKSSWKKQDKKSPAFINERNQFISSIVRIDQSSLKFNLKLGVFKY